MTQLHKYITKSPITDFKSSLQNLISGYTHKYSEVLEAWARHAVPFGGNLLEPGHFLKQNASSGGKESGTKNQDPEVSENRYSVLYTLKGQYHHVGCSSQAEAQYVQGMMMTDGNRIPIGIYDEKTDSLEWEMIGQYFHSQDPLSDQQNRLDEILTIARALRRRDSSWQPGYLQKPGFFA